VNFQGITGFDISHWQGTVDFQKMKAAGARFVVMKAGQGNWEDDRFAENWVKAKGVLPRATYWYYDNRYPPKDQAEKYFEIIQHDLEGMCWLDLEDKQAGIYAGWRNWYDFIVRLKELYPGVRIGIYSGFYYMVEMLSYATKAQRDYFGQFPLWLAWYFSDPFHPIYKTIMTPLPWLAYDILQSGTPAIGIDAGVESKEIDYNQFHGDEVKFKQMFGGTTPPVEEEETMAIYKGTVIATATLQIRNGPGVTPTNDIGDLHYLDKVEASDVVNGWWKLIRVNGASATGYSFSNNGAYIRTDAVVSDPPPPAETFPAEIGLTIGSVTKTYVIKP
jgi:lysozyme